MKKTWIAIILCAFLLTGNRAWAQDKMPIIGKPTTTVSQMRQWAINRGADPDFVEQAQTFYDVSIRYGIDPAVTYTQSAKETNYFKFTGVVTKDYFNPCGLKITVGGGDYDILAHKKFKNWEEGITAQVHHLAIYAGHPDFPKPADQTPDPRHFPWIYNTAPFVEDLGAKWAPSPTYGNDIVKMVVSLRSTTVNGIIPDPDDVEIPTPIKPNLSRIFGQNRYQTAIEVSKQLSSGSDTVIITSGIQFADALVAAGLSQDSNGSGFHPIFVTGGSLEPDLVAHLDTMSIQKAIIVGGTNVVSQQVETYFNQREVEVTRLAGNNRFETANRVAETLQTKNIAILVNGFSFPDALSIAPFAASNGYPIYLTDGNTLDPTTLFNIEKADTVYLIGGEAVISKDIESLLSIDKSVIRLGGKDRFATSIKVAKKLYSSDTNLMIANGFVFADALVAAPLGATLQGPILLTAQQYLPAEVGNYLKTVQSKKVVVLGGEKAVNESVYEQINQVID